MTAQPASGCAFQCCSKSRTFVFPHPLPHNSFHEGYTSNVSWLAAHAVTVALFEPLNATLLPYLSVKMPYFVWKYLPDSL